MLSRLCEGSCELVPTELKRLKINRVDLVPEGANSAAFVTLYKGKEMNLMGFDDLMAKLKPEHADVIKAHMEELEKKASAAETDAAAAKAAAEDAKREADEANTRANNAEAETKKAKAEAEKALEGTTSFDEDEQLKKSIEGLDPAIQEYISTINKQKETAEMAAKAAIEKERHAEAVSKAEELKALPVEKERLVEFVEKSSTETVDMLTAIAKGIEATVLSEAGSTAKQQTFAKSSNAAWEAIEKKSELIAKEKGITKEAATAEVISTEPELYREYLEGGAN